MSMPLEDWNNTIKPRLDHISAGADMAKRNAEALAFRPGFLTHAEYDLKVARRTLEQALANIIEAEKAYQAKPVETAQ